MFTKWQVHFACVISLSVTKTQCCGYSYHYLGDEKAERLRVGKGFAQSNTAEKFAELGPAQTRAASVQSTGF